jgi:hypothetical protein
MIKHQSQRCELLPDIGKNEQENKPKTIFTAGLDKVGFIEAPFGTGQISGPEMEGIR